LGKIEEGCKYHFYGDGILRLDLRPIVGARVSGLRVGETGLCPAEPPAMEAKAGTPKSGEWKRNLTGSRGPGTVEKDLPSKLKKIEFFEPCILYFCFSPFFFYILFYFDFFRSSATA